MNKYAKHPEKTPLEKRYSRVRSLISTACDKMKVEPIIIGKENIPEGTACFFGNHLSAGGTLTYFKVFEKPFSFIAKEEVKEMPFVGKMFASSDGLFLDRKDLKQELRVMMKVQEKLSNNVCNVYIFPEGTRNRDNLRHTLEFHKGTFRSAMKAGVPICPVVNYGGFRILSLKQNHSRYPVIIKFLKPIYPEEYNGKSTEEIGAIVQSMIQKELTFNVRKMDHEIMYKSGDKNYRFNRIY